MKVEDLSSFIENTVDAMESRETAGTNPVSGSSMLPTGGSSEARTIGDNKSKITQVYPKPFPSHWVDEKHEPDVTARSHLVTAEHRLPEYLGYFSVGKNEGEDILKEELNGILERQFGGVECWDDVTNARLDVKLMRAARALEMQFFEKMGVWAQRLPRHVAKARCGKIIKGRWVDTNKGDSSCPDYRARFVAKEYDVGVDPTLYAATPPRGVEVAPCSGSRAA